MRVGRDVEKEGKGENFRIAPYVVIWIWICVRTIICLDVRNVRVTLCNVLDMCVRLKCV